MKSFIIVILLFSLAISSGTSISEETAKEYGGIGFVVIKCEEKFPIAEIFENTPASKAGLEIGDEIIRVDKREIKAMNLFEVVKMLRGAIGTSVVLTIVKKGIDTDISIKRERIAPSLYKKTIFNEYIGYIKFYSNDLTTPDIEAIFSHFKEQNAKALIIDFRNFAGFRPFNTDLNFIRIYSDDNRIGFLEDSNRHRTELNVDKPMMQAIIPTAIIVNNETAGGAEMITIALRDYGKAYVIGQKTKGNTFTIKNEKGIPTHKYISPKGIDVHEKGIMPDKVFETQRCEIISDAVIQEAIKYLENKLK